MFGSPEKSTTFAAALREKLTTGFTIYSFTIYHLKERKCGNKKTLALFLKRLGSLEKSTTFAAALGEKPTTYLPFTNCSFTI